MPKILFATAVSILMSATVAAAQMPEIFVGYTNLQAEGLPNRNNPNNWVFDTEFFRDRATLHGVNASVTAYNEVGIGITGDFSWARRSSGQDFAGGRADQNTDVYYVLGGPTVKFNRNHRAQPFARVMAGIGYTRFKASTELVNPTGLGTSGNSFVIGGTDFAASVGGGLDVRVNDRLKIRVFQVDWAPVFLKDRTVDVLGSGGIIEPTTLNGQRQDNVRLSFGVAF
jgi:opacity protein-like surface antigen